MSASIMIANDPAVQSRFSPALLREMICAEVTNACAKLSGLDTIILTGSMARDEASIFHDSTVTIVRGDAEFLLVFRGGSNIPAAHVINRVTKSVEARLAQQGLQCKVGLSPVSTSFLEEIVPHIFGYELRTCGRVIWGDQAALERVPAFAATEIPQDDAVRLLCNRMLELLELIASAEPASQTVQYAIVKLYLDMATSFLVFAGAYRPTYRERVAELQRLAASSSATDAPFQLPEFAAAVAHCTRVKLSTTDLATHDFPLASDDTTQWLNEAVESAHRLWRWELARMLKIDPNSSDEEMLARWASSQSWSSRLRGWMRVARDADAGTARRNWMRWVRLALRRSPRQSVYAASCHLFFRLPDLFISAGLRDESLTQLNLLLPVALEVNPELEWRGMAAAIARNYHRFVEFTRT